MERILSDIKSVPGVRGVLVLDKDAFASHHLLPATFSSESIHNMGIKLLKLSEKMDEQSRMDLKFEHGFGLIYNLEKSVILIFGDSSLNFSFLGLVLKSALQAIERKLTEESTKPVKIKTESTRNGLSRHTTFVVDKKSLGLLIEAVNLVAKGLAKTCGSFWVSQNLRKSKERVVKEFPFVANFYVDNNATISLIKGKEEFLNENLVFALIKWIYLFMNSSGLEIQNSRQTQSLGVRDLTAKISRSLDEIGFYSIYQKMANLKAQNS
jgi:predicted regulator of Ras-like GTPase activity (Roadblock/LC7/MglB family)